MSATKAPDDRRLVKTRTPGIYKRGDHYVAVFRDHTGRQRKRVAPTLAAARAAKDEGRADVNRGEFLAVSRVTFAQYAPQWIASYRGRTSRGVGPRTLAMYRTDIGVDDEGNLTGKGAAQFFGRTLLAEIGASDLKAYAKRLEDKGLARSSVRRALAPLKALLADAVEDKLIRYNPAAGLRNLAPGKQDEEAVEKVKALTPNELAALVEHTPGEWRPFVMFLAETGLRIGEAVEARWRDLDRGDRRLTISRQWHRQTVSLPKGRKTRTVPLSARLDAMLWEHRKQTRARDDDLIFTGKFGARINQGNLAARVLKPACVAAGLGQMIADGKAEPHAESWVSFHTFRHTCATQLFRNGWNAAQVSRYLGHADAGFTLRTYVHLLDEDLPEPNVLDSLAWGNDGATDHTETGRTAVEGFSAAIPLPLRDRTTQPNHAETAGSDYESAALTS